MNAILQDLPLPARLVPWPSAAPTTLARCLLLALLLHVWLVLWLGNAPGGTAPLGQGVFGAINVSLRGPVTAGAVAVVVPPVPANSQPGEAVAPRWGGAVRSVEPRADSAPGAARLGLHTPTAPAQPVTPVIAAKPVTPAMPVMPVTAAVTPAPGEATQAPDIAPPEPLPGRVLQELAAPWPVPALAREPLPPSTAPALPAAAALPPVPAPNAVIATPPPERQLVSPLSHAAAAPAVAPLPRLAAPVAPAAPPELAPPPELAAAPAPLRRLQAAPDVARTPAPELSRSGELPALALPAAPALPAAGLPSVHAGADDAGAQVGRDVATPPAAAASAVPRLNLELVRPRGGELSRYSTRGVLPVLPRPPERDDKLAKGIEKAARADCRQAYSGMGPLALIPLAVDALNKDGSCKW